jgi:hypothetical protein
MKFYTYLSKYESLEISIQIIKLTNSFFIYVATPELYFDNLSLSLNTQDCVKLIRIKS